MKASLFISTLFLVGAQAHAETREITLAEVTKRVSTEHYYVRENAERVYQAKQSIQLARRNLLPRLNLWRLIGNISNPISMLGIVEDIAPFLVPSNWLRVKEEKLFAKATQEGYRSLWGNELLTARGLFMQASLEERLSESLDENTRTLERVREIVRVREELGGMPAGSTRQLDIQLLAAHDESRSLRRITQENRVQLAYLLGFTGGVEAKPSGIQYRGSDETPTLRFDDYADRILEISPERKQFVALIAAAKYVKRERYFSFLGASSASRGAAGGIFDALPAQDGLGFGLGASLRIVRSQKKILELQKTGVEETLRKNLRLLVESYNLDLEARDESAERVRLSRDSVAALESRIHLGAPVDLLELIQAADAQMEALVTYHTVQVRLLLNADRLRRLTYTDAYSFSSVKTP